MVDILGWLVLSITPGFFVAIHFIWFFISGKRVLPKVSLTVVEIANLIIIPAWFLWVFDYTQELDCCGGGAYFSPDHRLSIYALILLCIGFYFYFKLRRELATPVVEVIGNCFLWIGVALNTFILIHVSYVLGVIGNVPVIMLFILRMVENHNLFMERMEQNSFVERNGISWLFQTILSLKALQKFPVLLIFCLPVLAILTGCLLLFGQKPDSLIKAFTDTYTYGLSGLETCPCLDGHFLCTIAAKGHERLVKPTRYGIRHGHQIKVNRQLLVSNAFEELIQEKAPWIHKVIRRVYNYLGGNVFKLYDALSNKWISDFTYVAMKPLEFFFLFTLYTFDKKPEDRIEKQYIKPEDRRRLEIGK